MLTGLATAGSELFHDPDGNSYARIRRADHRESWPIDSKEFQTWLAGICWKELHFAPSATTLTTVTGSLKGAAIFDGEEQPVYLRIAQHGEAIYIDLCNDQWEVVEVSSQGHRVLSDPPVRFRRTSVMRPLPSPVPGGDINELWDFVNVLNEDERILLISALLEALRPDTPFPVIVFEGQQGSGKSKAQSLIRDLLDLSKANLRATPRQVEDIFVGAVNNWVYSLNNLSKLSPREQDALCTLATGGGYAGRTLYTNLDETVAEVKRPVFMNGTRTLATAQDLIDRCVVIELPAIAGVNVKTEQELDEAFKAARPRSFGAILDALALVLGALPNVKLDEHPRMADFARLGVAAESVLGWGDGIFVRAYRRNRVKSMAHGLEASPVARAVVQYVSDHAQGYYGPLGIYLTQLGEYRAGETLAWPMSARGLGDRYCHVKPAVGTLKECANESRNITATGFRREIISYVIWLYYQFSLSFRDVEDLLSERGVIVSHESIRRWSLKFGPRYRRRLKRREGRLGDTWHVDEVFIKIRGRLHYLWRAVDQDGDVIDILVQRRRDAKAAKRFFNRALSAQGAEPRSLITDKLRSYSPAAQEVLPGTRHDTSQYANNRAEVSHQPTRQRERQMRRFKSCRQAQRFLSLHARVNNLFHYGRHLLRAMNHWLFRARAFAVWQQVTCA